MLCLCSASGRFLTAATIISENTDSSSMLPLMVSVPFAPSIT